MTKYKIRTDLIRRKEVLNERYEYDHLEAQLGVTKRQIHDAVKTVGKNSEKIEKFLRNKTFIRIR
jgi:hypothetical protein